MCQAPGQALSQKRLKLTFATILGGGCYYICPPTHFTDGETEAPGRIGTQPWLPLKWGFPDSSVMSSEGVPLPAVAKALGFQQGLPHSLGVAGQGLSVLGCKVGC